MLFNSYEFIFVFLPITLASFFSSRKLCRYLLIIASLIFYSWWNIYYLPVLIASVCINYFISLHVKNSPAWLFLGIVINFAALIFCKISGVLPLGISFFTFTQTAYIVNVFRDTAKPESFTLYLEYVTFFGYITSGPIADYRDMMPQFKNAGAVNYDDIAKGITLFAFGLFKKVCVADTLAPVVNELFLRSDTLTFLEAWGAALGYSMQLYFDFSGYSDMAVAIGLMLGLRLPENFNSPYKSTSIIDFWRRWHMSLGLWIRDYIYIPLGGSRTGDMKRTRNVMISMIFTGLWHGLGWTFVIWGVLHGIMLAVNHQWRRAVHKMPGLLAWGVTFMCIVVCWVVFRAESITQAGNILASMLSLKGITFEIMNIGRKKLLASALLVVLLFPNTKQIISQHFRPGVIWLIAVIVMYVISFMRFSGISDFLYFQF